MRPASHPPHLVATSRILAGLVIVVALALYIPDLESAEAATQPLLPKPTVTND